jgi:hypothetical protein
MKDQLEKRLKELKREYEETRKILTDLEGKQTDIKNTILKLCGAIEIIEEELKKNGEYCDDKTSVIKQGNHRHVKEKVSPADTIKTTNPKWYKDTPVPDPLPKISGPDRNSVILRTIRIHAPPDRKFTPEKTDELFAGVYTRDEIDETLDILECDGMITRTRTGIRVK